MTPERLRSLPVDDEHQQPPAASSRDAAPARAALVGRSSSLVLTGVGLTTAVFLLGLGSVLLSPAGARVASWWPAAGVCVGVLAVSPRQWRALLLPCVFVGSATANAVAGRPWLVSVGFGIANVLEAGVGSWWLTRRDPGVRPTLGSLSELWRLLVAAVLGAIAIACTATAVVAFGQGGPAWQTWTSVAAAHAAAVLVIVPLLVRSPVSAVGWRGESVTQWLVVVGVTTAVFSPGQRLPLAFLVLPPLLWAALRFGVRRAAGQVLLVGVLASLLTARGAGPFAVAGTASDLHRAALHAALGLGRSPAVVGLLVQLLLLVCAVMTLALAVAVASQREALARASASEAFLEALIDSADVGLVATDGEGALTRVNQFSRRLRDIAPDEPVLSPDWSPAYQLLQADGVTPLAPDQTPLRRVLREGAVRDLEVVLSIPGQSPRHLLVHGRTIRSADGGVLGAVTAAHDITPLVDQQSQLRQALRDLAERKQFDDEVLETVNAGVLACDATGRVVLRNRAQRRVTGVQDGEPVSSDQVARRIELLLPDGSVLPPERSPLRRALAGEELHELPVRVRRQTDQGGTDLRDVVITARQIRTTEGVLLGAVAAFSDVTAERRIQQELRASAAFHDAVLAASPDLIFVSAPRTGAVSWSSRNLYQMLGFTEQALIDLGAGAVDVLVHPEDVTGLRAANLAAMDLVDGQVLALRYRLKNGEGHYRWLSRRVTPFSRDGAGSVTEVLGIARDVTDAVELEQRLAEAALHDALTGLPNRRLLADRLRTALSRTARSGTEVAVLFCDLDGFKHVNDTAGHAAGDEVLVTTAHRLRSVLRPQDTVARVGGDEFVVLLETSGLAATAGPDGPASRGAAASRELREGVRRVVERIEQALCLPVDVDGTGHVVTVSIGVTFARAGDDPEQSLRDADSAMYRAKSRGKNRAEVFDRGLREDAVQRGRVEHVLRAVLGSQQREDCGLTADTAEVAPRLWVAYQPIVDLATARIVGVEALARLQDGAGRTIAPDAFIPVAEETGLIAPLGHRVLRTACSDLAQWHREHPAHRHLGMAVNLSARQAGLSDLAQQVIDALRSAELAPHLLTLELTESVLVEAGRSTISTLQRLRDAGVLISIDDFGTGYASLRYLAELPVTGVKIDRSFTAGLPHDPASSSIVRAVAGLARDLQISCVVEGIETDEQLLALPPGVHGQGYLLARPMTAAQVAVHLRAQDPATGTTGPTTTSRP